MSCFRNNSEANLKEVSSEDHKSDIKEENLFMGHYKESERDIRNTEDAKGTNVECMKVEGGVFLLKDDSIMDRRGSKEEPDGKGSFSSTFGNIIANSEK